IEPHRKKPYNIGASLSNGAREALEYMMEGFRSGAFNTRSPEFKAGSDEQADLLARLLGGPESEPTDEVQSTVQGAEAPAYSAPSGSTAAGPQASTPGERGATN